MVIALSNGQTKQAFEISKCLFCLSSDILLKIISHYKNILDFGKSVWYNNNRGDNMKLIEREFYLEKRDRYARY